MTELSTVPLSPSAGKKTFFFYRPIDEQAPVSVLFSPKELSQASMLLASRNFGPGLIIWTLYYFLTWVFFILGLSITQLIFLPLLPVTVAILPWAFTVFWTSALFFFQGRLKTTMYALGEGEKVPWYKYFSGPPCSAEEAGGVRWKGYLLNGIIGVVKFFLNLAIALVPVAYAVSLLLQPFLGFLSSFHMKRLGMFRVIRLHFIGVAYNLFYHALLAVLITPLLLFEVSTLFLATVITRPVINALFCVYYAHAYGLANNPTAIVDHTPAKPIAPRLAMFAGFIPLISFMGPMLNGQMAKAVRILLIQFLLAVPPLLPFMPMLLSLVLSALLSIFEMINISESFYFISAIRATYGFLLALVALLLPYTSVLLVLVIVVYLAWICVNGADNFLVTRAHLSHQTVYHAEYFVKYLSVLHFPPVPGAFYTKDSESPKAEPKDAV
ncbi:hypothetical protein J8273_2126 [Carpediemonas membranifera]|uniref:Transmembrane protein n=1 Tax=Carpediemonas membranifera TaxID=201153 RepID=A0A8J6B010_9EUKA|nr:hypothetical protein J8273_2126 [Carpediemonas membranifera]|eukprot:KAG9396395.1 hypothetical protein J8273_2126 [Carpediemonas membranifera]